MPLIRLWHRQYLKIVIKAILVTNSGSAEQDQIIPQILEHSAYSNYEQMNVRELLSKVLLKQTDHSNNELESYEGELYLPNLIREVGEEAPQPLLFQNTAHGNERIHTKMITVDTGDYGGDNGKLDLTNWNTKSSDKSGNP